jgi:hypothetical protein
MKFFLLVSFILAITGFSFKNVSCEHRYVIRIWDRDFSLGYSIFYQIDGDSIIVKYQSGDESEKILMCQKLTESQCKMAWNWLSTHNIDSFSAEYRGRRMQDGDQKKVEFEVGNKTKTIVLSNAYLKDIDDLFGIINRMVNKDLQIYYKRPG